MNIKKIDVASVVLDIVGVIVAGLFIVTIFGIYRDNQKEQLCEYKGGIVLKDRRDVHCIKPDMFIPLK